jgi:hypothetical protein
LAPAIRDGSPKQSEANHPVEYESLRKVTLIERRSLRVSVVDSYLRHFVAIESPEAETLVRAFDLVYRVLRKVAGGEVEPMMNVLAGQFGDALRMIIFPRARHRPSFYLAKGDARILLSPAAVDLGGVCITPIERDFDRLQKDQIARMFDEVTLARDAFSTVTAEIRSGLVGGA